MCFLCAGPPVWTPLCLALWLRFTKPVCPAALCSDTSNSWITSRAFVTTSSPYTSAPIAPVSRLHPREIFPPHVVIIITSSYLCSPHLCSLDLLTNHSLFLPLLFWASLHICLQVLHNLSKKPRMPTSKN